MRNRPDTSQDGPTGENLLDQLVGLNLSNGWSIDTCIQRSGDQTGGRFSVGYECTNADGRRAFLKVIDLSEALQSKDPISSLGHLVDAVQCEVELLQVARRMDRVVNILGYDVVRELNGSPLPIPARK